MRAAMKSINDIIAANQAEDKTYTHQAPVMGTRGGQTDWERRIPCLPPVVTIIGKRVRTRIDMGLRTKGRRYE